MFGYILRIRRAGSYNKLVSRDIDWTMKQAAWYESKGFTVTVEEITKEGVYR